MMIVENYLIQTSQVANGVTAFAFAQSLSFTIAVFSVEAFKREVIAAKVGWIAVPIILSVIIYGGLIFFCLKIELDLIRMTSELALKSVAVEFSVGRFVCMVLGILPLTLAMMAVRHSAKAAG